MRNSRALDQYDRDLIGIVLSLIAGIIIGVVSPIALEAGIALGSLAATAFVYSTIFRHPPLQDRPTAQFAIVGWHALVALFLVAALA